MAFEQLLKMAHRLATPRRAAASPWRSPLRLDRGALGEVDLGLDGHGRGMALWEQAGQLWTLPVGPHVAPALARMPLGQGTRPRLLVNAEGRGMALWVDGIGGETQILGRALGASSGPTQVLQRTEGPVQQLQAAVDRRGNALVVWLQPGESGHDILARTFDLRSASWGEGAHRLGSTLGQEARVCLAANYREHALVLWQEEGPAEPRLVASHFWPTDRLWSDRPVPVVNRASQSHQVGMDDLGNALALWVHAPYGQRSTLEASAYDAQCCEWTPPVALAQAQVLSMPQLSMNGAGEALVAWCQAEGHGAVRLLCRTYARGRWLPGVDCLELGHEPVQAFSLALGTAGHACLVAVHRGPEGDWVSARRRQEEGWGEPHVLAPPAHTLYSQPLVQVCPQGASAVWMQGTGRERTLMLAETW